jgi:peptidoglycan-associated lipoprotein
MKKLLISILLANLLAACASQKPVEPEAVAPEPAPVVEAPAPAPAPMVEVDPLNDPNSLLAKRSTYYPFDVSAEGSP